MRADTKATTDDLLNVAEPLFAKHGVEHIALTKIVSTSRQRNRSALHYHFGSREGVLAAVLNRRLKEINALRQAMVDESEREGPSLTSLVRAVVAPFCLLVLNEPWGGDYVSIMAQLKFHPRLLGASTVDDTNLKPMRRCKQLIERALPDIPADVLGRRFRWLSDGVVFTVAQWSRHTAKPKRTREAIDALIDELIAYGVAALSAPVTRQTAAEQSSDAIRVAQRGELTN